MKPCPVVHFEMPFRDAKRVRNFYGKAFGWKTEEMGGEFGLYLLASTTEAGKDGRPKQRGAINGGFYPKRKGWPNPGVVIAVDDMKAAIKRVKAAGGKVKGKPADIPGVGSYVVFEDTEGNFSSLLQPKGM